MIRIASCQTNRLFILLERAEKEIRFSMANGTFKTKMHIDRHGPILMPNNCKNLNPPYFSLPSTFKVTKQLLQLKSNKTVITVTKCLVGTFYIFEAEFPFFHFYTKYLDHFSSYLIPTTYLDLWFLVTYYYYILPVTQLPATSVFKFYENFPFSTKYLNHFST